jgi:hypothetical protein
MLCRFAPHIVIACLSLGFPRRFHGAKDNVGSVRRVVVVLQRGHSTHGATRIQIEVTERQVRDFDEAVFLGPVRGRKVHVAGPVQLIAIAKVCNISTIGSGCRETAVGPFL